MTLLEIGRYDGPHLPVEYVHEEGDYRVVGLSSRVAFDRHEAMAHACNASAPGRPTRRIGATPCRKPPRRRVVSAWNEGERWWRAIRSSGTDDAGA